MNTTEKFEAAKKRVNEIREFHYHLISYIIVNIVLLIFRTPIVLFFMDVGDSTDEGFLRWLDVNTIVFPLLWGIGLFIHYAVVFGLKPKFIKNWEKRKLEQYLKEEEENKSQKWM